MKNLSKSISILLFTMVTTGSTILATDNAPTIVVEDINDNSGQKTAVSNSIEMPMISDDEMGSDEFVVPNAPILKPTNIITLRAIGLGVAPTNTVSKAQEIALAKRSAIVDAYRQLGEKLHGLQIEARDTIRDAVIQNSIVRTKLRSIVRGAEIMETQYADGLCQVEMEVKIDGRRWYKVLAGR